jgi:hypothetical protein
MMVPWRSEEAKDSKVGRFLLSLSTFAVWSWVCLRGLSIPSSVQIAIVSTSAMTRQIAVVVGVGNASGTGTSAICFIYLMLSIESETAKLTLAQCTGAAVA